MPARSAHRERLTIFFDGGCHPNPGPMETALVVRGQLRVRRDLGEGDSGLAEWLALRHAAEWAVAIGAADVLLLGDSRTVVAQALDPRCRDDRFRAHRDAILAAAAVIPRLHVRWIKRSRNLAGIALDRLRAQEAQADTAVP